MVSVDGEEREKGKEQKSKTDGEVKLQMGSQLPRCRSSWLKKEGP